MIHLVLPNDRQSDPCPRCGRTLYGMRGGDTFTLDAAEADCYAGPQS